MPIEDQASQDMYEKKTYISGCCIIPDAIPQIYASSGDVRPRMGLPVATTAAEIFLIHTNSWPSLLAVHGLPALEPVEVLCRLAEQFPSQQTLKYTSGSYGGWANCEDWIGLYVLSRQQLLLLTIMVNQKQ